MQRVAIVFIGLLMAHISTGQKKKDWNVLNQEFSLLGADSTSFKEKYKEQLTDPDTYDNIWKQFLAGFTKIDSNKAKFLNDLKIDFETFSNPDSSVTSLGFKYDFKFSYGKFQEKNNLRLNHSLSINASGNVAFDKNVNPNDFLSSSVGYNFRLFSGGVAKIQDDTAYFNRRAKLKKELSEIEDQQSLSNDPKVIEYFKGIRFTNHFYFRAHPKLGFESNQDFSKTQFTPGLHLGASLKTWDRNSKLRWFNVFDWPFALVRYVIRTDKQLSPSGFTFPTLNAGFDYVVPSKDTIRENLLGNMDPFPRIKFESSFKTYLTKIKKERIFFCANLRYYQEIGAPQQIIDADIASHLYYVLALQSSSGFYVSYTGGNLPFDSVEDQIYSIGFSYKFK